jgi:hypothetical protein
MRIAPSHVALLLLAIDIGNAEAWTGVFIEENSLERVI